MTYPTNQESATMTTPRFVTFTGYAATNVRQCLVCDAPGLTVSVARFSDGSTDAVCNQCGASEAPAAVESAPEDDGPTCAWCALPVWENAAGTWSTGHPSTGVATTCPGTAILHHVDPAPARVTGATPAPGTMIAPTMTRSDVAPVDLADCAGCSGRIARHGKGGTWSHVATDARGCMGHPRPRVD